MSGESQKRSEVSDHVALKEFLIPVTDIKVYRNAAISNDTKISLTKSIEKLSEGKSFGKITLEKKLPDDFSQLRIFF